MPERNYTYYDFTISLCSKCLRRVEAKIIFQNDNVYMLKRCPEHGTEKVLIAD
ncbi:MAG: radical SAM protein, partial [Candidatus Sericytochromatia bacterium]